MKNKDILKKAFTNNLKRFRNKKQLSQAQLAEDSDLSPGYIGDMETGKSHPSLNTVEKIAEALEIPPYLLLIPEEETLTTDMINQSENRLLKEIKKAMERIRLSINETS